MTAPNKVSGSPRDAIRPRDVLKARRLEARRFAISDGAPVEVVESGPSIAARVATLASRLTVRPVLTVGSYVPNLPWPWGLIDHAAKVLIPASSTVRASVSLPNASAQLVRASGVLPADGTRRVVLYLHGGAFLTCGANSHGRLVELLSQFADSPVLVVNYRLMPKHSIGMALDDCHDGYRWLKLLGYGPEQIVLAGDSAGGYLALALAQRLQDEGEEPAALVAISPLLQLAKEDKQAHPNIKTDAMFPAKAFDALGALVASAAAKNTVDGKPEEVYEPGAYPAGAAADADSRVRVRGAAARRTAGRKQAGSGRCAGRDTRLAGPGARLSGRRADRARGDPLVAPDRGVHPRGHRLALCRYPGGIGWAGQSARRADVRGPNPA